MSAISKTPKPPYYAVIFTSQRTEGDNGYEHTADRMVELAEQQEGYLGIESARNDIGITVSYWKDLDSIRKWKMHMEHLAAQDNARKKWYAHYKVRICLVERDYGFDSTHSA
ncbi:MAG TPA: antibiotic biosynthesis monooxygenase [Bacteroidia bacterium]|jgi:heme-degrading monooxygenase HmoA|nr:antibiotic biosynthesis monooxygenase [Bacteroidia bacterium]